VFNFVSQALKKNHPFYLDQLIKMTKFKIKQTFSSNFDQQNCLNFECLWRRFLFFIYKFKMYHSCIIKQSLWKP